MNFLQSKAERLADFLRRKIEAGEVRPPFPGARAWSDRLGVARKTLEQAVRILARQGMLVVRPRKRVQLAGKGRHRVESGRRSPRVRWLFDAGDLVDLSMLSEVFYAISEKLRRHGIEFGVEPCGASVLRAIHAAGRSPDELLLLPSLQTRIQKWFADFENALVLGMPEPGIALPFVSVDVVSAIRHATYRLARRGFRKVCLVLREANPTRMDEPFGRICQGAPRPVEGWVVRLPSDPYDQADAARRLALRTRRGHAMIAVYPVTAGLLTAALVQTRLKVPEEVEVVGMNTNPQGIRTVPVPTYYPFPVEQHAAAVAKIARGYFETGVVFRGHRLIPMRMISARS